MGIIFFVRNAILKSMYLKYFVILWLKPPICMEATIFLRGSVFICLWCFFFFAIFESFNYFMEKSVHDVSKNPFIVAMFVNIFNSFILLLCSSGGVCNIKLNTAILCSVGDLKWY